MQVEELKSRLTEADKKTEKVDGPELTRTKSNLSNGINGSAPGLPEKPPHLTDAQTAEKKGATIRNSDASTGVIVSLCSYKKISS